MSTATDHVKNSAAVAVAAIIAIGANLALTGPAAAHPTITKAGVGFTSTPPTPWPKATSPLTNLADFPKLTETQLATAISKERAERAATPAQTDPLVELTTQETLADGRTRVSIYSLAPGADPEKVADSLRAQGKKNVQLVRHTPASPIESGPQPMASTDCAYGQARTLSCPNAWWTNLGRTNPVVLFNDHSGAQWPVTDAVYKWNRTPNIDSWYTWNNCNQSNVHCVDVTSGSYGQGGWIGYTETTWNWGTSGAMFDAYVYLNDSYPPSTFTRNNVVTHELGHVLGLNHNQWNGDVMWWKANMREDIGGENPELLRQVYSVDR
ncbi:M43 family zinc metalloprotease [Nonomuraea zeae]|uniref:Peptidase M43 pregnancy-associated plasma-A domain-containing protein n=1 Tax=Nonomuraea zeae TaxID=1642303 RepID=A0A5S4FXF6_9ACTN|nr:M43 family zinc metalloprotease [Nonomuraea zeae]TMR25368.1 hypothetical protein ETD85_45475 [Nonomuraea zeae]